VKNQKVITRETENFLLFPLLGLTFRFWKFSLSRKYENLEKNFSLLGFGNFPFQENILLFPLLGLFFHF
jgi:hypothetical protein